MDITRVKRWSQMEPLKSEHTSDLDPSEVVTKVHKESPFPVREDLNEKIAIVVADVSSLKVHAIVNSTNEQLASSNASSQRILARGGPLLRQALKERIKTVRTGEARLSEGYNLPARHVIHTVGPKYNSKYITAAHSALCSCYTKVLSLALESRSTTVGLVSIHSVRKGFPPSEAAHLAVRVVRRFLEQHGDGFDLILFTMEPDSIEGSADLGTYQLILPLYFPRNAAEEEAACALLPADIGGPSGEPLIPERQIRIMDKPHDFNNKENTRPIDNDQSDEENGEDDDDQWMMASVMVDLTSGLETTEPVGRTAFARMSRDVDQRHQASMMPSILPAGLTGTAKPDPMALEIQRRARYERLLRKSRTENLAYMSSAEWLQLRGQDRQGRSIVCIIGSRLSAALADPQRAVLYLISQLDRLVDGPYVVVYFHTQVSSLETPSSQLLQNVYEVLDTRYKKHLAAFYIVHPTIWSRILTWWISLTNGLAWNWNWTADSTNGSNGGAGGEGLRKKIFLLGGVEFLTAIAPLEQFALPQFILEYDLKANGIGYAVPMKYSRNGSTSPTLATTPS